MRRNKLFGKGWERKRGKNPYQQTGLTVHFSRRPRIASDAAAFSPGGVRESKKAGEVGGEKGGERRKGEGRREKGWGKEERGGESMLYTLCVCRALTAFGKGKERTKLLVNPAGYCFAMAQDKGRRSE